jgi:hypothetical protein
LPGKAVPVGTLDCEYVEVEDWRAVDDAVLDMTLMGDPLLDCAEVQERTLMNAASELMEWYMMTDLEPSSQASR